jgi:hypothetical protein
MEVMKSPLCHCASINVSQVVKFDLGVDDRGMKKLKGSQERSIGIFKLCMCCSFVPHVRPP